MVLAECSLVLGFERRVNGNGSSEEEWQSVQNQALTYASGPDHPWLIETYIAAAPYPHSSVIGQEIFQGGLVLSDTDFRIFRDYGKIPGKAVCDEFMGRMEDEPHMGEV